MENRAIYIGPTILQSGIACFLTCGMPGEIFCPLPKSPDEIVSFKPDGVDGCIPVLVEHLAQ